MKVRFRCPVCGQFQKVVFLRHRKKDDKLEMSYSYGSLPGSSLVMQAHAPLGLDFPLLCDGTYIGIQQPYSEPLS